MDLHLEGKAALVTGGTRGIGREIALTLAAEGVDVGICGRDTERLAAVAAEIRERGVRGAAVAADLLVADDCRRAVDDVAAELGRLDILVNNASTSVDSTPARLEETTDDDLMVRINGKLLASMRCTRAALPYIRRSPQGRVIFIAGGTARHVSDANAALVSGPANAALANFARQLGHRLASDRILVNVVNPGTTKTDRYAARLLARAEQLGVSTEEAEAALEAETPLGRMVVPADIAPLVAFLASPLAGAILGQSIGVDGGESGAIVY